MLNKKIDNYIQTYDANIALAYKDLNNSDTILINENKIFPSASTIKLLILAELFNRVEKKEISLSDKVDIYKFDKVGGDGILKEIESEISLTYKDVATLMIILSDNYATNILIDTLGFDNINNLAKELNLSNTKLNRKMMDTEAAKKGLENKTCALDLLKILELIYSKTYISEEMSVLANDILLRQQVNGLNILLPEDTKIAHKTGDLDNLEHDVGIIYLEDIDYILCILTNELDTNYQGKKIISEISKMVYDYNINK